MFMIDETSSLKAFPKRLATISYTQKPPLPKESDGLYILNKNILISISII